MQVGKWGLAGMEQQEPETESESQFESESEWRFLRRMDEELEAEKPERRWLDGTMGEVEVGST